MTVLSALMIVPEISKDIGLSAVGVVASCSLIFAVVAASGSLASYSITEIYDMLAATGVVN